MRSTDPGRGLRLAYAGTPEFAAVALRQLLAGGFDVPLVLTQPDRPAGRGMQLTPSAVKQVATEHGLMLAQPRGLRLDGRWAEDAAAARQLLLQAAPDLLVVAAYGLILPDWVLQLPRLGAVNIHASLLPRWRGAAPIQRAIEAGDAQTGISIMQMDAGLDTGAVLAQQPLAIDASDTAASLHDRLAELGPALLLPVLEQLAAGAATAVPQPAAGVTYAAKLDKRESWLDWARPAAELERRIRAFQPAPGCQTRSGGSGLKIHAAALGAANCGVAAPGTILALADAGIEVACGQGTLWLTRIQKAGGKAMAAAQLLPGLGLEAGQRFDSGPPPA